MMIGRIRHKGRFRGAVAGSAVAVCALVLAACGSAPSGTEAATGSSAAPSPSTAQGSGSAATESSSEPTTPAGSGSETPETSEGGSGGPASSGTSEPTGSTGSAEVQADFGSACMVTDTGGIDDRSFNANSWKGVQDAADELGIDTQLLQSSAESDYVPNIRTLVQGDCGIIITVGALMSDATKEAAAKFPDQNFAIVDVTYPETIPNVRGLAFDTSQSAFLAGYLAAGMTESGKVAEFGGLPIPPVELYMDGFAKGVDYYNQQHDDDVATLGWDPDNPDKGLFAGSFTDTAKGQQITQQLMNQGADIVFPLAGNVNNGAVAAVKNAGEGKASMIWVDTDGCVTDEKDCGLFITSAEKHISVAVDTAITQAAEGHFEAGNYVGTLDNDGVGLAPYHQWKDRVPQDLQQEITQIKQQIIDGDITIESEFKPKTG